MTRYNHLHISVKGHQTKSFYGTYSKQYDLKFPKRPPQHVIDQVGENGNTGTVKEEQ